LLPSRVEERGFTAILPFDTTVPRVFRFKNHVYFEIASFSLAYASSTISNENEWKPFMALM
jgi:hypothetical protein